MISIKIKIDKKIVNHYKTLDKEFKILMKRLPSFFNNSLKIDPKAKQIFNNQFSKKFYSRESAGYFEAWPVMDLILHALAIGYQVGKNEKKYDQDLARLIYLGKELETFTLLKGRIPIMKVTQMNIGEEGSVTFFIKTRQQTTEILKKQGQDTAVKAHKALTKALKRFQDQKLNQIKGLDKGSKKR